ncbi:hypothetical protein Ancab_013603 [Ancistrocladus abbreviatus]
MNNDSLESQCGGGGAGSSNRIHNVQPLRDLESNWAVDLAKNLEDYLLKICSGEITGRDDAHFSINFAEAALLLQGSIQVYSRKVEYLYTLVLHALEFISHKRPQDQAEGTEFQPEASSSCTVHHDDSDQFWCLDDIPVDAKNSLDDFTSKDALNHYVKAPANLVVLEGDCLDSTGDGGELESYLLATNDLYRDFILLDPCDAVVVDDFLKGDRVGEGQNDGQRGSSLHSKACKSFLSPTRHSGGTTRKSSQRKTQEDARQTSPVGYGFEDNCRVGLDSSACNIPDNNNYGFETDDHYSVPRGFDDSDGDDDDPWMPLNPHEPGTLKVKPFRKVKTLKRPAAIKQISVAAEFPLAKLHGTISPELAGFFEKGLHARQRQQEYRSPATFEKLRQSLTNGRHDTSDKFCHLDDDNGDNGFDDGINDFEQPDFDMPAYSYMDEEAAFHHEKNDGSPSNCDPNAPKENEDPISQGTLEDLCRAHLDSLLASIAEGEKQTELAIRVSTWKQRIEHNLEEEDSRSPFDIHEYGERVLDTLSAGGNAMSFADVVVGQEKHDVARTFSALLQLVNDRKIDLDINGTSSESLCYTAVNPFHVRLLSHNNRGDNIQFRPSKKRPKSPIAKGG